MTEIKRRVQLSKEEKRVRAEEATRAAFEESEKNRCLRAMKTARLRAQRLSAENAKIWRVKLSASGPTVS